MAYLFYNWKFVALNPLYLFETNGKHPFVLCIYESLFIWFSLFCSLDSIIQILFCLSLSDLFHLA